MEDRYLESCRMDRVIYCLDHLNRLIDSAFQGLSDPQKTRILFIPFERFVVDPWPYMKTLEEFLGTKVTPTTRRVLKNQKVPRRMFAEGVGLSIYREYGWEPPQKNASETDELARRRDFAEREASPEAMAVLDRLCHEYEQRHLKGLLP